MSFDMSWADLELAGSADCLIEDIDPSGHVCP
jgi:hypothetical protein